MAFSSFSLQLHLVNSVKPTEHWQKIMKPPGTKL